MKDAVEVVKGRIVDVSQDGELTIKAKCDIGMLVKRDYQECVVQLQDSRPLSDKQRRSCYALLREIADFTGMGVEQSKEWLKMKFIADDLNCLMDTFSLSDAPMSLVAGFQRFLIRLIVDYDIPCAVNLLDYVDDIADYVYACLAKKKCCICGKDGGLYMTGDGKAISVCGDHLREIEEKGFDIIKELYHISDIQLDKHLLKVYGLGGKNAEYSDYDGEITEWCGG